MKDALQNKKAARPQFLISKTDRIKLNRHKSKKKNPAMRLISCSGYTLPGVEDFSTSVFVFFNWLSD